MDSRLGCGESRTLSREPLRWNAALLSENGRRQGFPRRIER